MSWLSYEPGDTRSRLLERLNDEEARWEPEQQFGGKTTRLGDFLADTWVAWFWLLIGIWLFLDLIT